MRDIKYRDHAVAPMLWSRYATYFFVMLAILLIPVLLAFKVEADVAIFHSDTYLEQGVEMTHESGTEKYIQYEHFWSDFEGVVPEDALVNNITLHLTWSPVTRVVSDGAVEDSPKEVTPESTHEEVMNELPTPEEQLGESLHEELPVEPDVAIPEETEPSSEAVIPVDSIDEPEEVIIEESTSDSPPEASDNSSETVGFEEVSWNHLYSLVNAQIEEEVATNTIVITEGSEPEVIITESISTTSGFVSEDILIENQAEKFFEVRYTIDGVTWQELGNVGFDDAQDTVFDLSPIGIDAIPNLRVAIRYTVRDGETTKIIFDSMRLEVGYGAPVIEEVAPPTLQNDSEPNFDVGAIKADVQSENIRAVVLERGGVFEFWYSVTDPQSGAVFWNKILGGGAVDENAPIGIKKRTIFWLDRNQQTLFGFAVDEESIFATPFQDDQESKVFLLPFTDENGKPWEALFNSSENVLEFSKVKSES
ncbi:hypothetical protein IPH92_00500 [Candidatus Kaiserbacteria bacterium]|nr:MAG: hypothetical protein IPH92_00500 [Candidatus Kaiserbacteria bacterium]